MIRESRSAAFLRSTLIVCGLISTGFTQGTDSENRPAYPLKGSLPPYTEFLDPAFPFREMTMDLSPFEGETDIATRLIALPLGGELFVAFDTELLRVAAVWHGEFSKPKGIGFKSYAEPLSKAGGGFLELASPEGNLFARVGRYPGCQLGRSFTRLDPRPAGIDPREPGKGPLSPDQGRWLGILDAADSPVLQYAISGSLVSETFTVGERKGEPVVIRSIQVETTPNDLIFAIQDLDTNPVTAFVAASGSPKRIQAIYHLDGSVTLEENAEPTPSPAPAITRWQETATTSFQTENKGLVFDVEYLELPAPNPWKRRIRPIDIKFLQDGDALLLTYDGDIYRLSGIGEPTEQVVWRRIAAGFNEPQTLALRDGEVFVFSRNGITRIDDLDSDGEIDRYTLFCNDFVQSADTRDFPSTLIARRDGSFLISKGGQQIGARNPHSGRVLRISPDGSEVSVFASGFRNAYLGYDAERDLVTASDQQGLWVPSTPVIHLEEGRFYGFEPAAPLDPLPTTPPLIWLPHRIAPSGVGQIHGFDYRAGPLDGSYLYLEYHRSALIKISESNDPKAATAASPLPVSVKTPLLNGSKNPKDGLPYIAGFQIWDCQAEKLEGLIRLRPAKEEFPLPSSVVGLPQGLIISFDTPLPPDRALDPARYEINAWDYIRSEEYGSPQIRSDGSKGVDEWFVHTPFLSEDGRSVLLAIESTREAMQVEILNNLFGDWQASYTTLHKIEPVDIAKYGFGETDFAALFASEAKERLLAVDETPISASQGRLLYQKYGCMGCHSITKSTEGKSGPSFLNLYMTRRPLADGSNVQANNDYLRESILEPSKKIAAGFGGADAGMPSYAGILKEEEIQSILLFLQSLE